MRAYISKNLIYIVLLTLVFFFTVSSFNYITQGDDFVKWLSPDETANYVFTKLFGQTGNLSIYESYNIQVGDIMHPRSFRSDLGEMKPVSFLGIILVFGSIVKITSYKLIPYFTPFFASLGILFFYGIIKILFDKKNAIISSTLLAFFPVYVYYSARSMFHNVLFIVFLLASLYFGLKMARDKKGDMVEWKFFFLPFRYWLFASLSGLSFGLAVATRTSELIWLGPTILLIWIVNLRKIGLIRSLLFLSFSFLAMLPVFYYNQILYSSPYLGGYAEMNQSIINISDASADIVKSTVTGEINKVSVLFEKIKSSIFYFGLQPKQSFLRMKYYFVYMFPWLFWGSMLGWLFYFIAFIKKPNKTQATYFLSYLLLSFILIIYYGSWGFTDNPDPNSFTIGNSYTRYWLPIYLGAIPLFSLFLLRMTNIISKIFPKTHSGSWDFRSTTFTFLFILSVIVSLSLYSLNFILSGSEEGLIYVVGQQKKSKLSAKKVLDLTEHNSAIITFYHDKLLFPERKVIVGLFDSKEMNRRYALLVKSLPLYYYNFTFPESDLKYLNERKLAEVGLGIELVEKTDADFTLYRIIQKE